MRKNIGLFLLKKKASKLKRKVEVNNLETAKTAGIIYEANNPQNGEVVKGFIELLKKEDIKAESIALFLSKNSPEMPISSVNNFYLTNKELGFFRIPYTEDAKRFMKKEYDILIDCNFEKNFSLQYLSTLSKARFKVGPSGGYHQNVCDMIIVMKKPVKMNEFLEQVICYLKMINQ